MNELSLIHRTLPAREGQGPHPTLLLLHGRGTDENDLLPMAHDLDPRLFTISARGPLSFPYGGHAWYDLDRRGVGYPEAASLGTSLEKLDHFLDQIVETYPVDPGRLYVGGFSMGAAMSSTLALLYPKRVAGAVVLSGYLPLYADLPFQSDGAAGHPVFQAHGIYDEVIPVQWGRLTRDAFEGTSVSLTYREYPIAHQTSGEEMSDLAAWFTDVLDSP